MSRLIITDVISKCYIVFSEYSFTYCISYVIFIIVDIFYPTGADPTYQLISLQSLRCSPLAVVHYSFVGHFLAFAATSTRE
jgi:hypothetical protein